MGCTLGCDDTCCLRFGLAALSSQCPTVKAVRKESIPPEGRRRLSLKGLAYRDQVLPSRLLASLYHDASAPCLKRPAVEGLEDDRTSLGLSKALTAHSPSLVELSLLLPLQTRYVRDALRLSRASPRGVVFPALWRMGVLMSLMSDPAAVGEAGAAAAAAVAAAAAAAAGSNNTLDPAATNGHKAENIQAPA